MYPSRKSYRAFIDSNNISSVKLSIVLHNVFPFHIEGRKGAPIAAPLYALTPYCSE